MVVQDMVHEGVDVSVEHLLGSDLRVQYEFKELTQLLREISARPRNDYMIISDPAWPIDDFDVSRWVITLEGRVRLDRVAAFRQRLESRDDVIRARVEETRDGRIAIRLVTTGGIAMGPLEEAVSELKVRDVRTLKAGRSSHPVYA